MASAVVKIRLEWRWEEGSGDNCIMCGDACFLRQLTGFLMVGREPNRQENLIFCQSCGEIIEK